MRRACKLILGVGLAVAASGAAVAAQERPVERAFEHYERIRSALAQDTTEGVAAEARALSALAADLAGERAGRAAASLSRARHIEEAREQFGLLSEELVPRFLDANLPAVQAFVCSMKQKPWVQRGTTPANPYYGKAMATCGTPMKDQRRP